MDACSIDFPIRVFNRGVVGVGGVVGIYNCKIEISTCAGGNIERLIPLSERGHLRIQV